MGVNLYRHQARMVELLGDRPRRYFAWDCGTGKTIGTLAACAARPMRTLILAPLTVLRTAWASDATLFPSVRFAVCHGGAAQQRKTIGEVACGRFDAVATTYESYRSRATEWANAGIERLVLDEAVKAKNPDSKTFRSLVPLADRCRSVIALSGYPAPNGPQDWWAQMRLVDRRVLGDSFWGYCAKYTTMRREPVPDGRGGRREVVKEWTQTPAQRDSLAAALAPTVWRLRKSECLDLPRQIDQVLEVPLSAEERRAYDMAANELRVMDRRIKSEASLMKIRQIVGGAVISDGDHGPVAHHVGASKLEALREWCESLPPDEPVVVVAEFRHQINRLVAMLSQIAETDRLDGTNSKDSAAIIDRFSSGALRFLVIHPQAAGHGTNGLQRRCSYMAFFALSFNSDQYIQTRDRIHRSGMGARPATYVHLLATLEDGDPSIDHAMMRALRGKRGRAAAVEEAIRAVSSIP